MNRKKSNKSKGKKKSMFIANVHHSDGSGAGYKIDLDRIFSIQQVFMTKHHVSLGAVTQVANGASDGAFSFTLADIGDSANWLAVFDEYQISAVKLRFIARQNAIAGAAVASYIPGFLATALDFDDSAAVGIGVLADYNTYQETEAWKSVVRVFKPKISIATYGGGVLTNYSQFTPDKKLGWIDNADPSVTHNGCKWAIRAGAVAQTALSAWDVEETLYVKWRMSL